MRNATLNVYQLESIYLAPPFKMAAEKYPREYPRVPSIDEIDRNDFVALKKARDQWARDR